MIEVAATDLKIFFASGGGKNFTGVDYSFVKSHPTFRAAEALGRAFVPKMCDLRDGKSQQPLYKESTMRVLTILFLLCLIVAPAQGTLKGICGDCNLDASVNILDALLVMNAAVGNVSVPPLAKHICDVDGSGGPTTTDGLLILQFSSGLIPTLSCPTMPPAVAPNSIIEPALATFGTCVQGQSSGNPWTFTVLGNMGFPSGAAGAVQSGSPAFALASQWVTTINAQLGPNYVANPTSGNCFTVTDAAGAAASIQLGNCVADATGTPCPF